MVKTDGASEHCATNAGCPVLVFHEEDEKKR